jgi:hypothetical protein
MLNYSLLLSCLYNNVVVAPFLPVPKNMIILYVYLMGYHSLYIFIPNHLYSFSVQHGFKSELPSNLKGDPSPQYNNDDFLVELKSRLQTAQQTARERLITAKHKSKEYYDKHTEELSIRAGDKVLLYEEAGRESFVPNG